MQGLTASIVPAAGAVVFLLSYPLLRHLATATDWRPSVPTLFVAWLCAYLLVYFLCGPASFIAWDGEGNLAVAMHHYMATGHDGGRFSHAIGGGQDMYTWFVGMQFLNPEPLLFHVFPTWVAVLAHKAAIGALGFVGSYLLARRVAPHSSMLALALAMLYPVSHDYLLTYSTEFGTGFAAIPLVVHLCVARTGARTYWPWVFVAATIIAAAEPMKVFPALLVAYVGVAVLLPGVSLRRAAAAFLICVVAAVLSWHEVLYALLVSAPHLQRALGGGAPQAAPLAMAAAETFRMTHGYGIASGILAASAGALLLRGAPAAGRAAAAAVWALASMTAAHAFPWDRIGLPFLNQLNHQMYMVLALGTLMTPMAALAFAGPHGPGADRRGGWRPAAVVMAVALGVLSARIASDLIRLTQSGGQSLFHGIDALAEPDWKPDRSYRTATFGEMPSPNVVAGYYGFDAFDGQLNLNPAHWSDYWLAVVRGNRKHIAGTRLGWDWSLWDGAAYDAERSIRFDLLAIANVRYLFSPLPLSAHGPRPLHVPPRERWGRVRPEFFDGLGAYLRFRLKRVFDPGDVYVYELPDALPRVFAASRLVPVPSGMGTEAFHELVARTAPDRGAVVSADDLPSLGEPHPLSVTSFVKVRDGYDIAVSAPAGGVVVVNNVHLPFWRATADGRPTPIVSANGVHMAVAVPPGTSTLGVRYDRPLLREAIFGGSASSITR